MSLNLLLTWSACLLFLPLQDRVSVHKFDVSRPDELPALVELVSSLVQPGWRVNLVNNAAILPKTYSEANFRAVISTNVLYDCVHLANGGVEQALIRPRI